MKQFYYNLGRLLLLMLVILTPNLLEAQSRLVKGTVIEDGTGIGIPGANVRIKGTTSGAVTDLDGNYQIEASNGDVLVFSFVGYLPEEITVGNQSQIDVSLVQDIKTLDELIVVGYGTQERARVTGAISSVSAKEISEQPVISVDQALQGRAAGVTVANSGSPGQNPIVRIRGMGTVGDNNPLYVIDGMPAGGLNEINPSDIESMQVLKDASAAAIYGSRAANGVVIITTKKGKKGKTSVNFDSYYGIQRAWKQLDLLNREQYIAYGRELIANSPANNDDNPDNNIALPTRLTENGLEAPYSNIDTDWQDEMFRPAPIQDYNLSVSGGGDNAIFNIAGGYFNQEGIMLGTGFERYSFRANSEFTLGRFKVGETLTIARTERQNEPYSGGRSQIEHLIKMTPYIPALDPDRVGGFGGVTSNALDGSDPENPVLNANLRQNLDENIKLLGTAYAGFEILDGLEYKLVLGLDMNYGFNDQFTPVINSPGQYHYNATADIDQQRTEFISPLISNQLSYEKNFGDHQISAVAVAERQTSRFKSTRAIGETNLSSEIQVPGFFGTPNIAGRMDEYALISYLARVNYDYAGKYLFGASVRRDGGSRFGSEKWGTFPAVSAGWRISEESFLETSAVISEMKLRASWGKVGNDRIGDYRYQSTIVGGQYYVLGTDQSLAPALTSEALANQDIKWETTIMTNIGLDMGFLNDKIRASVEYFNNETVDMLLEVPIAPSLGYDVAPTANVGTVVNRGFELTAGYYKSGGEFEWSLGGNISFIENELTSLGIGNSISGAGFIFTGDPVTFTQEGEPIAYFWGYEVEGIFQTQAEIDAAPTQRSGTAPGDIRFRDLNGDGVIDGSDKTNIGHFLPDYTYGINATANYKNFDLSVFLQGVSGNEILNTNRYHSEGMTRLFNAGTAVLDRWTAPGQVTDVPRAVNTDPNLNSRISDRFVEDGSYMRLKNLTLGYSVPTSALDVFGDGFIKNIRFYATAQNLITITDYTGYDPEIGVRPDLANAGGFRGAQNQTLNSGVDFGQFPQARTIIGGIQIGF